MPQLFARVSLLSGLILVSCAGPSDSPAPHVRGPIPTRIMQPASLIFPVPRPRRAKVLGSGEREVLADVHYASIFESRASGGDVARFDGEIARVSARLTYGLGNGIDLAVEPSVLFAGSGGLDQLVDDFHSLTGFAGGGREFSPRDQYSMRLAKDGVVAYELEEDQLLLGDLPVSLVVAIRDEDRDGPAVSVRATIELPTGDEDRGSGSGGLDAAAGVMMERSLGRWSYFLGADGMRVSQPRGFRDANVEVRSILYASGGLEYRWSDKTSILGQAVLQMPLTRDLSVEEIDREILDLGIGISRDIRPGLRFTASFHEDAVAASGPDATLFGAFTFHF